MEETSYPQWAQQLIRDCSESKRRAVKHDIYKRMRDNTLSPRAMRMFLVGGWPVVEQFSLYMGHNLGKTRYGRHPGEDMARRWLIRNIRVELNHADYWLNWARCSECWLLLSTSGVLRSWAPTRRQADHRRDHDNWHHDEIGRAHV